MSDVLYGYKPRLKLMRHQLDALRAAVHEQKYRSSLALPHAGFQARLLRDGADEGGADHGNLDPMRSTRVRRWW